MNEARKFAMLREILEVESDSAPALARQLAGFDIASLRSRADLGRIPVIRKSELTAMQAAAPPFGGLVTMRPPLLKRLMASPGPIFEPEGSREDWWGVGPALRAAGFRPGGIVLNCF